ncbi:MAG TPA: serine hydrolase [Flavipsychrobacter sp.]|nr:serine hydrolase [Flavipsychrobacter sp.]
MRYFFLIVLLIATGTRVFAGGPVSEQKYLFFLHNKFVELFDLKEVHPQYGRAEYLEILDQFKNAGFRVISEKRPKDTDIKQYAQKVVRQVDSLLKKGVKPGNITVVGTSKGGYIAQYVSTYLKNPAMNFVFIGCYQHSDIKDRADIQFCGNILSIYEKSDSFGVSAVKRKEASPLRVPHFKEIELHTNLNHGFLYRPMEEWMQPTIQWAKGHYGLLGKNELGKAIDSLLRSRPGQLFNGIILIQEADHVLYSINRGYADRELKMPITNNSQFVIGSVSKQFTAALVLLELEKRHLQLTDAIGKYLPQLPQPWKDSVTIYQLLTHTHGIASKDKPLSFRPGSKMEYSQSNTGYLLLSEIVEKTSGKPFSTLTAALFQQCGMKNSFHPDDKRYRNLVKGYTQQTDGNIRFDSQSFQATPAAGSMIATAADLAKWNDHFFGGKLLQPETYDLLTTIQPHVVRQHPLWGATEYGLGITIRDQENRVQLGQTGFTPGFVSMNYYFPETKTSVIALQNIAYDPGKKWQDQFYYHVRIIETIREQLKLGQQKIERKNFTASGDSMPYRLVYPLNQDFTQKYPLVIYLHGGGSRGSDNEKPVSKLPAAFLDAATRALYPCYLLVPQCAEEDSWVSFPGFPGSLEAVGTRSGTTLIQLIRHLVETKDVDPHRIYLTGFSMGGEGTYNILSRAPDLFACGVPLAAVGDTSNALAFKNMPLWVFHGSADSVNGVEYDRMMVEAIKRKGGNPRFTELPDVSHNCQREAYNRKELWQWMFAQRRD